MYRRQTKKHFPTLTIDFFFFFRLYSYYTFWYESETTYDKKLSVDLTFEIRTSVKIQIEWNSRNTIKFYLLGLNSTIFFFFSW